eukprot:8477902-Karenia_brevis.AAC.1
MQQFFRLAQLAPLFSFFYSTCIADGGAVRFVPHGKIFHWLLFPACAAGLLLALVLASAAGLFEL